MNFENSYLPMTSKTIHAVNSDVTQVTLDGYDVLRVTKDKEIFEIDEPTYAKIMGIEFQDGTIEVKVLSRLLPDAPDYARGFIGVAFRINEDNSKFESLYIRPTNGRTDDELRKIHATQYFSYPNHKFFRTREETPGKYESIADIGLDEWIDLKIEVKGNTANLYINNTTEPVLSVNDLKHGPDMKGSVALWVEIGTEGFFRDLKIS